MKKVLRSIAFGAGFISGFIGAMISKDNEFDPDDPAFVEVKYPDPNPELVAALERYLEDTLIHDLYVPLFGESIGDFAITEDGWTAAYDHSINEWKVVNIG
jgi:hypothetical protein